MNYKYISIIFLLLVSFGYIGFVNAATYGENIGISGYFNGHFNLSCGVDICVKSFTPPGFSETYITVFGSNSTIIYQGDNSQTALQSALDYSNVHIKVSCGYFDQIPTALIMHSNTWFEGSGSCTYIRSAVSNAGYLLSSYGNDYNFATYAATYGSTINKGSNFQVSDMVLDRNWAPPNYLMVMYGINKLSVYNIEFLNNRGWNLAIYRSYNVQAHDLKFTTDSSTWTDGIHVIDSSLVNINNIVGTVGDDLVAVTNWADNVASVNINNVVGVSRNPCDSTGDACNSNGAPLVFIGDEISLAGGGLSISQININNINDVSVSGSGDLSTVTVLEQGSAHQAVISNIEISNINSRNTAGDGIVINGASNVNIVNAVVQNSNVGISRSLPYSFGGSISINSAHQITVSNSVIKDWHDNAMNIENSYRVVVDHNIVDSILSSDNRGITLCYSSSTCAIDEATISDNTIDVQTGDPLFLGYVGYSTLSNIVVHGNTINNRAYPVALELRNYIAHSIISDNIFQTVGDQYYVIEYNTATLTGLIMRNNYGTSPFDFGVTATPPISFGSGDTYFNSAKGLQCYSVAYGSGNWRYYNNGSNGC